MNLAHLHLALNHGPVFGFIISVLVFAHGVFWKQRDVIRVSLLMFAAAALLTVPVYLTGDPAEHLVKGLPGVESSLIEEHDDAATWAIIGASVVGLFALYLWRLTRTKDLTPWLRTGFVVLAILCCGILLRTAALGGKIHHPETRTNFIAPASGEDDKD